jgi:nitrite reductase (NO-forming)
MKMLRDRNDRATLGAIGVLLGAGLLVALGNAFVGDVRSLMAGVAYADPSGDALLAHNVPAEAPHSIIRAPTDLPQTPGDRKAATVRIELETIERIGDLGDGTTYRYWTFNGQVPGPFVRIRVGDTVKVTLKNHEDSWMPHNVDFHAVTGPGGGAVATVADPGDSRSFTFRAMNPGLYVYHCAIPTAAQHIANGMYGLILVEPESGLPEVDREFYVMQGEIYTEEPFGTKGELTESYEKLLNETPEYFVFNGAANALSESNALHAKVGETVRIYFGVGGPNKTSSFHVIGEIFDRVYELASLTAEPLSNVQTVTVPAGGAAAVDFKVEVPGTYVLVDHALSRTTRGLVGHLIVEGEDQPAIFMADGPMAEVDDATH